MSVKIRLKRTGRRNRTSFRIVACDTRSSRDGKVLERLGSYDPEEKIPDQQIRVKPDRVEYWLSVGAQPSAIVTRLLKKKGIVPVEVRARLKAKPKPEGEKASEG